MRALRALAQRNPLAVVHVGTDAEDTFLAPEQQGPSLARILSAVTSDEPAEIAPASIDRIRQTVAVLRASEERVESRLADLKLENQRLQTRLQAAQVQAETAEAMVSFQAARADAAEQRSRDVETRFVRMLNDLADELEATGFDGVNLLTAAIPGERDGPLG
jgi:acetolactate synthase small subunit